MGKKTRSECLEWRKKMPAIKAVCSSSVIVEIFLFSNLVTAAEAGEHPTWGKFQVFVLSQLGRGRTFVRVAVIVQLVVESDQQKGQTLRNTSS